MNVAQTVVNKVFALYFLNNCLSVAPQYLEHVEFSSSMLSKWIMSWVKALETQWKDPHPQPLWYFARGKTWLNTLAKKCDQKFIFPLKWSKGRANVSKREVAQAKDAGSNKMYMASRISDMRFIYQQYFKSKHVWHVSHLTSACKSLLAESPGTVTG